MPRKKSKTDKGVPAFEKLQSFSTTTDIQDKERWNVDKLTKTQYEYNVDEEDKIQESSFMCGMCGMEFVSDSLLIDHMSVHVDDGSYKSDLQGDLVSLHVPSTVQSSQAARKWEHKTGCSDVVSSKSRQSTDNLTEEKCQKNGNEKSVKGQSETFITVKSFTGSKISHYTGTVNKKDKRFSCDECQLPFESNLLLNQHSLTHIIPNHFQTFHCETCGDNFQEKSQFKEHLKVHDNLAGNKSVKKQKLDRSKLRCQRCDKTFATKWHLERHEMTHKRKNSYKCKTCGALFTDLHSLTKHMLLHSGSSHWCRVCGEKFSNLSLLNIHSRAHIAANK